MRRARRWIAGVALLIASGSCVQAPAPISVPVPQPPVPRATPVPLGDVTLDGAMIQGGMAIGRAPPGTARLTLDGQAVALAPDGRFLIAFDRDARATATLVAMAGDGRRESRTLTVLPRAWDVSRLSTLPKYPVPLPAFEAVRPGELARIDAARRIDGGAQGWRQAFRWPAAGRISTMFGSQRVYRNGEAGAYHSGTDIAVPQGTPVLAPADGVVVLASDHPFTLEGNLLMIDHGMGLNSALMHLSRITVREGDRVAQGQLVAWSGMTGRATGPHLHWSLRWRDARIDPTLVAGPMVTAR